MSDIITLMEQYDNVNACLRAETEKKVQVLEKIATYAVWINKQSAACGAAKKRYQDCLTAHMKMYPASYDDRDHGDNRNGSTEILKSVLYEKWYKTCMRGLDSGVSGEDRYDPDDRDTALAMQLSGPGKVHKTDTDVIRIEHVVAKAKKDYYGKKQKKCLDTLDYLNDQIAKLDRELSKVRDTIQQLEVNRANTARYAACASLVEE